MKKKHFFLRLCFVLCFKLASGQYTKADWNERDSWMKTSWLLEWAKVTPGNIVADIGCHEGYLTTRLSNQVGGKGRVYAVDVRDDRLAVLRENANAQNLRNIITILGDYDDPKLPEGALDFVFLIDTYHEISSYKKVLNHIRKSLKPGGQIMVLEKLKDRIKGESRENQVAAHSIALKYVQKELEQAGFSVISKIQNHGLWQNEKDKQMWVLLAKKVLQ